MPTKSRTEQLLNAYINGNDISNFVPLSRNEQILKDMILGNEQTSSPQSRIESLYQKLDEKIKNSSGSDINTLQYVIDNKKGDGKPSCASLFRDYKGTNLDIISQCDFSKITDMNNMFSRCLNLTTIPQLDTSSCTNMSYMFYNCSNLTTIPQLDTSSCTSMSYMFYNCKKLKIIDITHMKITNTSYSTSFAYNCYSLVKLIIRNMDTIPILNLSAFESCYHFYGTTNATYNPDGLKDGRIYVPDDKVEELKAAEKWNAFADIIRPLSEYIEEVDLKNISGYEDEQGNITTNELTYEKIN